MNTNTIFNNKNIQFDNDSFGIISIEMTDTPVAVNRKMNIRFALDNSGSMGDICSDQRTKMRHVAFATEQILTKLQEEQNVMTTVSIQSFDDTRKVIVAHETLTAASLQDMVQKVGHIKPCGGTNIAMVLQNEAKIEPTDGSESVFILLSDGQDTTGEGRNKLITYASRIDPNTRVITVGCGTDHDYQLFKGILGCRKNGIYKFVGNVEEISLACSEMIFNLLNSVLKRVRITVCGGEIYNWATNTWVDHLEIDNLVVGCKKTYSVRSPDPAAMTATISGILVETGQLIEEIILGAAFGQDLSIDKFRQQTLELLFEATKMNGTFDRRSSINELKTRLKNMLVSMKKFMDERGLRDDKRMQVLCDDIFMSHQTLGTTDGLMYTTSRQSSQGTQSIYNNTLPRASHFEADDELLNIPMPVRGITMCISQMEEDEQFFRSPADLVLTSMRQERLPVLDEKDDEMDDDVLHNHQMLASDESPYATTRAITFMREASQTQNIMD